MVAVIAAVPPSLERTYPALREDEVRKNHTGPRRATAVAIWPTPVRDAEDAQRSAARAALAGESNPDQQQQGTGQDRRSLSSTIACSGADDPEPESQAPGDGEIAEQVALPRRPGAAASVAC